jgi:hypothetical protein
VAISLRERRTQLALGGGVLAILVVFLLLKVVGGGGGSSGALPVTTSPTVAPIVSPSPTPAPQPTVIFGGRDPFQPLFSSSTPSPTGTGTPSPTGTGTPSPTPSPTSTSTGTGKGSSTTIGGHVVQLDDVFVSTSGVKKAQIEVDGTVYTVAVGQTFDDNFMLVSFVGDPCTNLVFGDQPFQLCTAGGK